MAAIDRVEYTYIVGMMKKKCLSSFTRISTLRQAEEEPPEVMRPRRNG